MGFEDILLQTLGNRIHMKPGAWSKRCHRPATRGLFGVWGCIHLTSTKIRGMNHFLSGNWSRPIVLHMFGDDHSEFPTIFVWTNDYRNPSVRTYRSENWQPTKRKLLLTCFLVVIKRGNPNFKCHSSGVGTPSEGSSSVIDGAGAKIMRKNEQL